MKTDLLLSYNFELTCESMALMNISYGPSKGDRSTSYILTIEGNTSTTEEWTITSAVTEIRTHDSRVPAIEEGMRFALHSPLPRCKDFVFIVIYF